MLTLNEIRDLQNSKAKHMHSSNTTSLYIPASHLRPKSSPAPRRPPRVSGQAPYPYNFQLQHRPASVAAAPDIAPIPHRRHSAATVGAPVRPRSYGPRSSPLAGPAIRGDGALDVVEEGKSLQSKRASTYRPSRISSTTDIASMSPPKPALPRPHSYGGRATQASLASLVSQDLPAPRYVQRPTSMSESALRIESSAPPSTASLPEAPSSVKRRSLLSSLSFVKRKDSKSNALSPTSPSTPPSSYASPQSIPSAPHPTRRSSESIPARPAPVHTHSRQSSIPPTSARRKSVLSAIYFGKRDDVTEEPLELPASPTPSSPDLPELPKLAHTRPLSWVSSWEAPSPSRSRTTSQTSVSSAEPDSALVSIPSSSLPSSRRTSDESDGSVSATQEAGLPVKHSSSIIGGPLRWSKPKGEKASFDGGEKVNVEVQLLEKNSEGAKGEDGRKKTGLWRRFSLKSQT
ncbi:hypothetical protein PLICRDRAFT_173363 [Plicaturopsis crispa FD-325 SS-3]|nr:hypothetical protein PLICRDRAFT_173363 [Plicaturopsis crispa FD-325 SS-3]